MASSVVAPQPTPTTPAPLESRIKTDSKDAFLERQRLKELEETKREKLEKQKREAELKAKVEEEKRLRGAPASVLSTDPEEAKRQFELKRQQKEAEDTKKKRAAELADKERVRRELEADRIAKYGAAAPSSPAKPEKPELSAAEKSKLEYQREKKEDAAAREKLRQQIEEDKVKRFNLASKSAEELALEKKKARQAQLEMANARRARLGLPLFESVEAMDASMSENAAPPSGAIPSSPATDPHEMSSLREARLKNLTSAPAPTFEPMPVPAASAPDVATPSAINFQELARLRAQREAQLSRLESPAATPTPSPAKPDTPSRAVDPTVQAEREARLQRLLQQQAQDTPTSSSAPAPATPTTPSKSSATIQFRMQDGRVITGEFDAKDPFRTLHEYAAAFMPLHTIFNLMIPFPKREFDESDFQTSISALGLTPRAALTVLTLDLRGIALQGTGPVYPGDDEDDIDVDNMDYDQLTELGQRIGSVRAGLSAAQIARLPSAAYDADAHSSTPICAICREDFDDKKMVTQLSCNHVFHTSPCLTLWLRDHKSCPYCKQLVEVPPKPQ